MPTATIGMVLATAAVLLLGWTVRQVLTWILVAALFSVLLGPVTDLVERRLHLRRSLATLAVFLFGFVLLAMQGPRQTCVGAERSTRTLRPSR